MSKSINKVILLGNVGQDPEIRFMQSGDAVANLSLATSESWKDKTTGEKKEKTEWHRVVVFGKLAEVVRDYVKKGSKIYIEGALQTRKWQDQSGVERYTTEVVLKPFNSELVLLSGGDQQPQPQQNQHQQAKQNGYQPQQPTLDPDNMTGFDDEIPF